MMEIATISKIAGRMIEAPYRLGGMSPREGFDCFSYLYRFYSDLGVAVPKRKGGYTIRNYKDKYERNPRLAKLALLRFLKGFGDAVDPNFMQPGDLCLIRTQDPDEPCSAVYVGAGNLLTCDVRVGVMIFPRNKIATRIEEVRRPWAKL